MFQDPFMVMALGVSFLAVFYGLTCLIKALSRILPIFLRVLTELLAVVVIPGGLATAFFVIFGEDVADFLIVGLRGDPSGGVVEILPGTRLGEYSVEKLPGREVSLRSLHDGQIRILKPGDKLSLYVGLWLWQLSVPR